MEESQGASTFEARIFNVGLAPFVALVALFFAWWGSFHEIVCDCISIRGDVPLLYSYSSCYAYAFGSLVGALFACALLKRWKGSIFPLALTALATLAGCFAMFCLALGTLQWSISVALQLVLNAVSAAFAIALLMAASKIPSSDLPVVLFVVFGTDFLINNVLLPTLVYVSFWLVAVAQAIALALIAALTTAIFRQESKGALVIQGFNASRAALFAEGDGERAHISLRPIFHLVAYSFLFGAMHVELSTLIENSHNRSIPYAIGALAALVLFYLSFMRNSSSPRIWPKVTSVVFPLTVAAFLLLPDLETATSYVPGAFTVCSYFFYEMIFLLGCFSIAQQSRLTLGRTLAIGYAVKSFGYLVGTVTCHAILSFAPFDILQTPSAAVAMFALAIAATFWIGDSVDAKKLWGMRIELSPRMARLSDIADQCDKLARAFKLSPKEREIVYLLAQGKSTEDVTRELCISIHTTRTHIRNIYSKTDVHSRKELEAVLNAL